MKTGSTRPAEFLWAPALHPLGVVGTILSTIINYSFLRDFQLQSRFWIGTSGFRDLITATAGFWASFGRTRCFRPFMCCASDFPLGIALGGLQFRRGRSGGRRRHGNAIRMPTDFVPLEHDIPALWLSLMKRQITGFSGRHPGVWPG